MRRGGLYVLANIRGGGESAQPGIGPRSRTSARAPTRTSSPSPRTCWRAASRGRPGSAAWAAPTAGCWSATCSRAAPISSARSCARCRCSMLFTTSTRDDRVNPATPARWPPSCASAAIARPRRRRRQPPAGLHVRPRLRLPLARARRRAWTGTGMRCRVGEFELDTSARRSGRERGRRGWGAGGRWRFIGLHVTP